MKKITVALGNSHNDFDRQLKDLLNGMVEAIEHISNEQEIIAEYQGKLFQKQHAEVLQSSLCEICHRKADIITTTLANGQYKAFCNVCLAK